MTHSSSRFKETQLKPKEFNTYAMLATEMAVDTETNGGDVRDGTGFCVGISAAVKLSGEYLYTYVPVAHNEDNVSEEVKELFINVMNSRETLVMHNAKFDLESLGTAKITLKPKWYCTMMMAHFLNENVPKGLDWLSRHELKTEGKIHAGFEPIWRMKLGHMIPVAEMELYAGIDAVRCLQLFEKMYPFFVKSGFDGSEM